MHPAAFKILKKIRGHTHLQKLAILSHSHPTRRSPAFLLFLFYEMTTDTYTHTRTRRETDKTAFEQLYY